MVRDDKEKGICVVTRESESIESLLKRFKRKVTKSDILKEFKLTTEYLKPSVKRRKKEVEARRRRIKEQMKVEKEFQKKKKKKGDRKANEISSSS